MYLSHLPPASKHCKDYAIKEEQEAIISYNDEMKKNEFRVFKKWMQSLAKKIKLFCLFAILFCSSFLFAQKTLTFSYTGSVQTFTVPCGVVTINVKAWGAGGSGGGADSYIGAPGGGGGFVKSDIAVSPGQTLTIIVGGGAGPGATNATCAGGGVQGWGNNIIDGGRGGNAGCSPYSGGGGGGGAGTGLFNGAVPLIVAAGGGGGSGGGQFSAGGAGGGAGKDGDPSPGSCSSYGVAGASVNGIGNQGADKGSGDGAGGGGGGGGYYGGTGGGAPPGCDCGGCGGGGGTSWSSGINPIIINGNGQAPGNNADPDLPAGVAIGGYNSAGGNGFMAITYVEGEPIAAFSNANVCLGNPEQFTDNSTVASGIISSWNWNFGDGNTSVQQSPSHLFAASGTYTVTLVVTTNYGCTDTIANVQTVNPNPVSNFSAAPVCYGSATQFTDMSTGGGNTWNWDLGDGNTSSLQNPSHLYAVPGNYTATFSVTAMPGGCLSVSSKNISVFAVPVSGFTASDVCANLPTVFTDASSGASQWHWQFGDGGTSSLQNPAHNYLGFGSYPVTLITISGNGCNDTITDSVQMFSLPVVDFSTDKVCLGFPTTFQDISFIPAGVNTAWHWGFGDGNFSTIQNLQYAYSSPGTFNVTLTVTSDHGCEASVSKPVAVYSLPSAAFSSSPETKVQLVDEINFYDQSSSNVVKWSWDFGDNTTSFNPSPSHLYNDTGTYNVVLIVETQYGCLDTTQRTLEVKESTFYIPNAFTPNGDGINDYFFGEGIGIKQYAMSVYDRWGNRVFSCSEYDLPQSASCKWDGTVEKRSSSGHDVQQDVYVWKVNYTSVFDRAYTLIGNVSLVK